MDSCNYFSKIKSCYNYYTCFYIEQYSFFVIAVQKVLDQTATVTALLDIWISHTV